MKTEPQKLTFQVNEDKTINVEYYFDRKTLGLATDEINLIIKPNDLDETVTEFTLTTLKKNAIWDYSKEEIEHLVINDLISYYGVKKLKQ